jgi:hypothetical protein
MRLILSVALLATCTAGAALAQTSPPPQPKAGVAAPAQKAPGKPQAAKTDPGIDAYTSCVSQWEKSTHMSRQEWARACRRVADRIQNLVVK